MVIEEEHKGDEESPYRIFVFLNIILDLILNLDLNLDLILNLSLCLCSSSSRQSETPWNKSWACWRWEW